MEAVERVAQFLEEAGTYYLATVEGDQPRVRPFGTVLVSGGKLYIQTGKVKPVSKQIAANPKVEISAFKDGTWIRIAGELAEDDSRDVRVAMLEKMPLLRACTVRMMEICRCCISKKQQLPSAHLPQLPRQWNSDKEKCND